MAEILQMDFTLLTCSILLSIEFLLVSLDFTVFSVITLFANPDIISPNKKASFEFSFYTDNPEKIKSIAFNVHSDEYSVMTNNGH